MRFLLTAIPLALLAWADSGSTQEVGYTVKPGDTLAISVWKEPDLQGDVLVTPDGAFAFPLVGQVDARGKTVTDLQKTLSEGLQKYISEPVVTVSVRDIKGNKVYVIGQVNKPGEFIVNPRVDVMQALSMAGGTTPFASLGNIIILRRAGTKAGSHALRLHVRGKGPRSRTKHRTAERRRRRRALTARTLTMRTQYAVAAALTGFIGTASAADWSLDPKVTLNVVADDNIGLTEVPGEEVDVFGGELDAELAIRSETPRSSFRLTPRVRATMYPSDEDEESDEQYLYVNWDFRGQRSATSLDAYYSQRTILGRYFPDSEIPDDGELGEPDPGEGIGSTSQDDEDRLQIVPAVSFEFTERVALDLKAGYLDVAFDEQVANDRQDFSNLYGTAGLRFQLSPSRSIAVIATASLYEPDGEVDTDAQSVSLEWTNDVSETSQVYIRGGANRVQAGVTDAETGFNGGAGVKWSFEVTQLFFDVNHYVDPSSFRPGGGARSTAVPGRAPAQSDDDTQVFRARHSRWQRRRRRHVRGPRVRDGGHRFWLAHVAPVHAGRRI